MSHPIPRVPGHPVFGSLAELRDDRLGLLMRLPREYGDIAAIGTGLFRVVVVSAPGLCHEILNVKADSFTKGLGLSVLARPLLGDGLLTSEREVHRRQRKLVSPAFVHGRIASYAEAIAACADEHAERISKRREVDLSAEMMHLTLDVVGRTLFGADLGPDANVVGEAFTHVMQHVSRQIGSALPMPPAIPTPANLRARRVIRRLDAVVYRVIRERRAAARDTGDFLSMLLAARDQDDGSAMTDEQVRDEAMTIMIAGHETTANVLAWAFYLLARHPAVLSRLEAECDAVLGGRIPTLQDASRLPYAAQVFKEAMRLYPPAYMVARRAAQRVTVGPYELPKGALVILNIVGIHHRPEYFPDPEAFLPERFAPEAERSIPKHAYLPFGGGPRICIGNHFALMEGQLALAHLAQRLRFELMPQSLDVVPDPSMTLRPKDGIHVKVVRRDGAADRPYATASAGAA
jgi:cytochrome P450